MNPITVLVLLIEIFVCGLVIVGFLAGTGGDRVIVKASLVVGIGGLLVAALTAQGTLQFRLEPPGWLIVAITMVSLGLVFVCVLLLAETRSIQPGPEPDPELVTGRLPRVPLAPGSVESLPGPRTSFTRPALGAGETVLGVRRPERNDSTTPVVRRAGERRAQPMNHRQESERSL